MDYMTVNEASVKWNLSIRRIQTMCAEGKIPNVTKFGKSWAIPTDAIKPKDGRIRSGQYVNWRNTEPEGEDKS